MSMYRDSVLGLCLDLNGPDGNVFVIMGLGNDLAQQLNQKEEWKQALEALKLMGAGYMSFLGMFKEFFPMVTLVGYERVATLHGAVDEVLDED